MSFHKIQYTPAEVLFIILYIDVRIRSQDMISEQRLLKFSYNRINIYQLSDFLL